MYFPPDVWFIIKTMEYQMLYPPNIQKQYISNIKSFVRLPYLLKQHQNKNTTHQVLFLRHNYPLFWNVFQEQYIQTIVEDEINHMNKTFNSIYIKQICNSLNS